MHLRKIQKKFFPKAHKKSEPPALVNVPLVSQGTRVDCPVLPNTLCSEFQHTTSCREAKAALVRQGHGSVESEVVLPESRPGDTIGDWIIVPSATGERRSALLEPSFRDITLSEPVSSQLLFRLERLEQEMKDTQLQQQQEIKDVRLQQQQETEDVRKSLQGQIDVLNARAQEIRVGEFLAIIRESITALARVKRIYHIDRPRARDHNIPWRFVQFLKTASADGGRIAQRNVNVHTNVETEVPGLIDGETDPIFRDLLAYFRTLDEETKQAGLNRF